MMAKEYIEQRDGGYWVAGSRVSLESIVLSFLRGAAPETIAQSFPVLRLEEVYGAITYYLAHCQELDSYLRAVEPQFEALRLEFRRANPTLSRKLAEAGAHNQLQRP